MHHGNCGCKLESELQTSYICLRNYLNIPGIRVYNSSVDSNDGGIVFKEYNNRLSPEFITSDEDECELLFKVPFLQACDIGNFLLINESSCQLEVKLYVNRSEVDFSDIETVNPTQTLNIPPDFHGSFIHTLNITKFKNTTYLTVYLNSKGPEVKIKYIGLRGKPLQYYTGVYNTKYEVVPSNNQNIEKIDKNLCIS